MVKSAEYEAMSWEEKGAVTALDFSDCDFRQRNIAGLCWLSKNLKKLILSDTILDPSCLVYELDDDGNSRYVLGDGNTPSHAYENRYPIMISFANASDRERRSYLKVNDAAKITIVPHGSLK